MFAFNQCFHLIRLILQLQGTNIEPELEAKFRRNEKFERWGFVFVMTIIIVCMLVRMVVDLDIFGAPADDQAANKRRGIEVTMECSFLLIASVCLIFLFHKFTVYARPYISSEERQ